MRSTFSLLILNLCLTTISCCHSDRNPDHRPRVNCTGMSLSSVPSAIDPATEVIVLTDNEFLSLTWTSYRRFDKLYELDLSRNKVSSLEKMPDLILPTLRVLHLTGNKLQELPASAFIAASKVLAIYLRANQLRTLNDDAFKHLSELEVLDLSQNLIRVLPLPLLTATATKTLKTFDVEDNRLKVMPNEFFSKLPDIPYVYLSKNPWVCSCEVGYLSTWLEDQGHNVYVHTGPSTHVNDPESVICDSPSPLKFRVIMDLTEDEYCSPSPLGDMDSFETPAPSPQTEGSAVSAATTRIFSLLPSTQTAAVTQANTIIPNQAITTTPTLAQTTTSTLTQTTVPTPTQTIMSTQTSTTTPVQTTGMIHTFIRSTTPTLPHTTTSNTFLTENIYRYYLAWTSWHGYYATEVATPKMVTDIGMEAEHTTISTAFQMTTIPTHTSTSTTRSTPLSTAAPHPTTTDPSWTTKQFPTNVGLGSRIQERPVVYYCWWLFIVYLCLCLLMVFWLCIIFLWSLRAYLRVYLPLARKKREQRKNTLRLLGHHVRQTEDTVGKGENAGWKWKAGVQAGAISLPLEGAGGVQAMFRSVLFVQRTGERKEGEGEEESGAVREDTERADGPTTSQKSMIRKGRGEMGGGETGEVHRKTVYKVIGREEEITGWSDVETSRKANEGNPSEQAESVRQGCSERNGRSSEPKKRYSLILREERVDGQVPDQRRSRESSFWNEWVVGEWMLGDGGGEGAGGDAGVEDWWSLMPLIARGTELEPRGEDGSTATNATSETHL